MSSTSTTTSPPRARSDQEHPFLWQLLSTVSLSTTACASTPIMDHPLGGVLSSVF